MPIDRKPLARALAKATAYADAGNTERAEEWAAHLVWLLGCADILRVDAAMIADEPAR